MITAAVITLCICNTLILGYAVNRICRALERILAPSASGPSESKAPEVPPDEMDKARRQFEAEMAAFQELMNYNQDTAYGINKHEEV